MDRLISEQAVLDAIYMWIIHDGSNYVSIKKQIKAIPSAEPKTGHWIGIDEEPHEDYECDKCGYVVSTYTANIKPHTEYKFCPNCGARMVEPQESEG